MALVQDDLTGPTLSRRARLESLWGALDVERSSFTGHWRLLGDHILPRRTRFFLSDNNKGDRRSNKIIDSTASFSARTLQAGMMAGITSPARPWFRLTTPDPDLADVSAVKEWLHTTTQRMNTVFLRSNLYNALPIVYGDIGVFATAAMAVMEDEEDIIRCHTFPLGSFVLANDAELRVRVFMREFTLSVRQIVEKFCPLVEGKRDLSQCSATIRDAWTRGDAALEARHDIMHAVYPNPMADPRKLASKYKAFASCYWEKNSKRDENPFLKEEGFDEFPILAPRWEVSGEDVYGTNGPGMMALGDIMQLQLGEKRAAQALDKLVNPPMKGPTSLLTSPVNMLPGGMTWVDTNAGSQTLEPSYKIDPRFDHLEAKQAQVRLRIQRAFHEDLFLMLAQSDRRQITAREIEERHEEKLLALGPVLERLNTDLLDPLIDRTFAIMVRRGLIPRPPQELEGVKLRVEYISIMQQAQKLVSLVGVDRFAGFAVQLATVNRDVMDKVDFDEIIEEYGEATGIAPKILRPDDEVAAIRQARQQGEAALQRAAVLKDATAGAKNLAQADTSGKNALTDILAGGAAAGGVPA